MQFNVELIKLKTRIFRQSYCLISTGQYIKNVSSVDSTVNSTGTCSNGVAGSLLVSYARARAEGLGFACSGGLAQRPERLILLIVGLLLGERALVMVIWTIAVLSHITALQRFRSVLEAAHREKDDHGSC